jgi:intein/homing endonuclease
MEIQSEEENLNKKSFKFTSDRELSALNIPANWQEMNLSSLTKHASVGKDGMLQSNGGKEIDLGGFNIHEAIGNNPECLFVKVFAIKKDEVNDNGDYFNEDELKKATSTFIGVPVFVNHQNDDIEKARGKVVHAWYDDNRGGIYTINMVDKVAFPRLARGLEAGYVTGSSMGCFPAEMRVLMASGIYKQISDIRAGDEVVTHTGNLESVENVQIHEDKTNDDLIVIKAEGIPTEISATKEHPFFVVKKQDHCIVTGDYMGFPKSHRQQFEKRSKLGSYQMDGHKEAVAQAQLEPYDFEWKEAKDLQKGDMLCFPVSDHEIFDENATEGKAKLIGYFLAEGSYLKRKGKHVEIQFCFSYAERNTFVAEVVDLISQEFPKANKPWVQDRIDKNISVVHVSGREISEWFYKHCGEYSHGKKLNKKCLYWPKDIQKHIVAGWINGDGCHRKAAIKDKYNSFAESIDIATVSENLHYQMRFLFSRLGVYSTSCFSNHLGKKKGYHTSIAACESYKLSDVLADSKKISSKFRKPRLRVTENYILIPIKKIYKRYNDKPVYNLEVSNDNSFIIEGVAVHNCSVKHSCCSVCHTRAATAKEFCSHIKERKKRMFNGEHECKYHDRPNAGDEPCPLCGKKKGEKKINKFKDQQIFEHNYGVKFIEDSFVVNPACHDCLVSDILNPSELQKKVAHVTDVIKKYALSVENQEPNDGCNDGSCSLRKVAGVKEIGDLNEAMNKMERVVRSMMAQKSKVSLEYVSDIIKVCADVQKIADELVEMGYARLPSPNEDQVAFGVAEHASPINPQGAPGQTSTPAMAAPSAPAAAQPMQKPVQSALSQPGSFSAQTTEYGDDIGRVTKPSFMPRKSEIVEDFVKISHMIRDRIANLEEKLAEGMELGLSSDYRATDGDISVVITSDDDGDMFVSAFNGTRMTKWASVDTLSSELRQLVINDPTEAARRLLISGYGGINRSEDTMNSNDNNDNLKIAKRKDAPDVTTQAQLENSGLLYGARKGDAPDKTTQSQLDGHIKKDETSVSPVERHASPTDISESQLGGKSGFMVRWSNTPDVITEGQWTAANREVYANLPSDWTEGAKESQLEALRKTYKWTEPSETTEGQLAKKASSSAVDLIKAASDGISTAIGFYGLTAEQVKKAFAVAGKNMEKTAFSVLFNAAPWLVEQRVKNVSLKRFLSKEASASDLGIEPMDALVAGIADHVGSLPADQVIKAASWISKEQVAFQTAIDNAEKFASVEEDSSVNEDDIFRKAFRESNFPEDGLFKICATIEDDINVDPAAGDAFVRAVHKFASNQVSEAFGVSELAPMSIDIDDSTGIVEATLKVASMLDQDERKYYNEWLESSSNPVNADSSSLDDRRSKRASVLNKIDDLEKKAQMMGGQMPANLNPAGMGAGMNLPGGSVPPGVPGVEALTTGPGIPGPGGAPAAAADPLAGLGGDGMDAAGDDEAPESANPPMAVCVVCGNNDVDVSGGKSKCKGPGCGSGFSLKVVPASLLDGAADAGSASEESEPAVEKGLGGSGAALPPGGGMPPVAASAKLDVDALKKVASTVEFGSVSPITGNRNTVKLADGTWACLDSGQKYIVRVAASAKDPKSIWAQWEWVPQVKKASCSSCSRKKQAFVNALSSMGISEAQFDAMPVNKKAEAIIAVHQSGNYSEIKQASVDGDARSAIKQAFTVHGEFPMNDCMEKLARRYGENALALSGPCEGKNLADCVCNGLAKEKVYTTGLASKIASVWSDKDAMDNCLEDLIRSGMTLGKAAYACDGMKTKYASVEELFAEAMSGDDFGGGDSDGSDDNDGDDADPFDGGNDSIDITHKGDNDMEIDLKLHADPEMLNAIEKAISEIMSGVPSTDGGDEENVEFEISDDADESEDFDVDTSDDSDENSENSEIEEGKDSKDMNNLDTNMEKESDMTKMAPKAAESNDERIQREAMALRRGRVVGVGKLELDVSKIAKSLSKSASDKSVSTTVPQDVADFPSSGDGEKDMSDSAGKTDSGSGLEGIEDATVPSKGTSAFGESNKPEMGNAVTGRVASFESALAKMAKDMKLQRGNVQDDKDIGTYSKDGIEMTSPDVPSKGGSDLDVPSIPAGDGSFEGESEAGYTAEKQNHMTGGDAGSGGDTKTSGVRGELALKIAARMVEEKVISAMQMPAKINELSRYQVSQLQDLEKVMFRNASKGLKTASVSGGLEKPLLIADSSSEKNVSSDLKSKISSLFRLHKQNEMADQTESAKLRDVFR